jgi:hypothetical protein
MQAGRGTRLYGLGHAMITPGNPGYAIIKVYRGWAGYKLGLLSIIEPSVSEYIYYPPCSFTDMYAVQYMPVNIVQVRFINLKINIRFCIVFSLRLV